MTFVIAAGVVGWIAAFLLFMRLQALQNEAPAQLSSSSKNDNAEKLEGLRKELTAAKEATERKSKQVEELKAEAKKKARREGKKEKAVDAAPEAAAEPADKEAKAEITRLKKAIVGLEKQIEITNKKAAATVKDAETIAAEQVSGKLDAEKAKAKEAIDSRKKVEKTLEELRASIKKKAESRPDVPGSGLDLKALDTEVVQELARYYRKGEHFEKMHNVAQGQLQLAQDRFNEQQKRYFAVCRELAVVAGKTPGSDGEARAMAESATQKTNAAVATSAPKNAAPKAEAASDDADGDGEKKKRRRRRRKKKGDGTEASADASNAADDNASDDGEDGASTETAVAADAPAADASGDAPVAAEASASEASLPKADAAKAEAPADVVATEAKADEKPAPAAEG